MPTRAQLLDGTLLVVLAIVILAPGLADTPLWDPDEARHAEIARRMHDATSLDEWLAPRLGTERYRDKPTLFYWLAGTAYALVGTNELGARLVPAAAAVGTLLIVYLWTATTVGRAAACWAGIVFITAVESAALGRFVNPDMLLTCCVTLGLVAVERWWSTGRIGWAAASGIATGLGVLAKGLVAAALVGGLGMLTAVLADGTWRGRARGALAWATSAAVVVAPWGLAVAIGDPGYLRELVWEHHVQRFLSPDAPHATTALVYVPVLLVGFFPWSILLPAGIAATLERPRARPLAIALLWVVGIIAFFALARGKLPTYLLPAVAPLAVLTGAAIARGTWLVGRWPRRLTQACAGLACVALLVAPVIVHGVAQTRYEGALASTSRLGFLLWPFGVAIALAAWRAPARLPLVLALGIVGVHVAWGAVAAPRVGTVRSAKALALLIERRAAPDAAVVAFGLRIPSLRFYGTRPLHVVHRARRLRKVVATHSEVFVVTSPRHAETVRRAGVPHRWASTGRRLLFASIPPEPPLGHAVTRSEAPL